ncbi:MAG: shikimate dehydrogenase [Alphaproteobacteria bacterium]|nr:shikimate dehydrogenase [Alphaproteobacteria bacterium]
MIKGSTKLAGVIGWPVKHSRSPRLHGFWAKHYGIDAAYVPLAVKPEDFDAAVRALPKLGFAGANVTVPHKEAALKLADIVDASAKRIGAANTLIFHADGKIEARNTDAFGFGAHLTQSAPDWRKDRPAVVLGAGGAARAILVGLLDAGVPEIRLANRTRARADNLAKEFGSKIRVVDWAARETALDKAGLLVNTTTQGMDGQPALDIDLAGLPADAVVNDLVYVPLETPLLAQARKRGLKTVDGLGMLLHQGRPGFAAWFGTMPDVTPELRAFVGEGLK